MTAIPDKMADGSKDNFEQFDDFVDKMTGWITVDCAAGGTISVATVDQKTRMGFRLTGAPASAATVRFDDGENVFAVRNETTGANNVVTVNSDTGAASPFTLRPGCAVLIFSNGVELRAALPIGGLQMEYLPARDWSPTVTAGCAVFTVFETTAGRPDIHQLAFDAAAIEHAQAELVLPLGWDGGTLFFRVNDAIPGGQGAGLDGRVWQVAGRALGADESFDQAVGSYVGVTIDDASLETRQRSALSAALTAAGTPAAGELVCLDLQRKRDDAADDLDTDAWFLGIELYFVRTKFLDE